MTSAEREANPVPISMCQWDTIPDEMKALNQWCVAQYPQKVPCRIPENGKPMAVDVTNVALLHSFADARAFCDAHKDEGWRLGFCLTDADPYTCVDMDYKSLDDDSKSRVGGIVDAFSSFTEVSTSHHGCHIWCKGPVQPGSRAAGIEVYSQKRFILMTGVPVNENLNLPIVDRTVELGYLRQYLDSRKSGVTEQNVGVVLDELEELEEKEDDDSLLNRILSFMRAGGKFHTLWEGNWHGMDYPSQSEADDALMAILVRFTKNREQLKRIFLRSALGDRILHPEKHGKKKPKDYLDRTINSAFQTLWEPSVDISEFVEQVAEKFEENQQRKDSFDELGWPPGPLGQLAKWIYDSSRLPNRTISLATAFAFASGIVGNAWSFGDGTQGCNLYTLIVGPSGIGKNAGASAISKILEACRGNDGVSVLDPFYSFVSYVSAPALRKQFVKQKQFLNIRKEVGELLLAMTQSNVSTRWSDYGSLIKDAYHESGVRSIIGGLGYSDKENNVDSMCSVCYSLFGETTPDGLFANMTTNLSEDGLVSRMSVFITNKARPLMNENKPPFPQNLVSLLLTMATDAISRNAVQETYVVPICADAKELFRKKEVEWTDKINGLSPDEHLMRSQYNRLNVKSLKYATLIAVFTNPESPQVTLDEMEYAIKLAEFGCDDILAANNKGYIGEGENPRVDALLEKAKLFLKMKPKRDWVKVWVKMQSDGCVPHKFLYNNLRNLRCYREYQMGASRGMETALEVLMAGGQLIELNPLDVQKNYGTKARVFKVLV